MSGHRVGLAVAFAGVLGTLGCPHRTPAGGDGTMPDPNPPDFASGPPLGEPPPPDPTAFGHEYLARIGARFQDRWRGFLENCRTRLPPTHSFNDPTRVTTLAVELDEAGAIRDVRVASSSGDAEFDRVALEVARDAGPLPAPPAALLSDDGRVHLAWRFARDRRQAGPAGAAVTRIAWEPARAVPMLLDAGRIGEAASRVVRAAGDGAGDDATAALLDAIAARAVRIALDSGDVATQRAAVDAAVAGHLPGVAERLRALATSAVDLDLRRDAIAALGSLGDAGAVELLLAVATGDDDPQQRGAAARALYAVGAGDRAWRALEPLLDDPDADHRQSALVVLAHFPAPDAVPRLSQLLAASNKRSVRLAAAAALGAAIEQSGHKAGKPLIACLSDRDGAVRAACAQALADAAAVGYQSRLAYWGVVTLLQDKDDRVRASAVAAAALLGGARFAKEMYRLRKEASPAVLAALARGLAAVRGEQGLARLLALAAADDVAIHRAVARALAHRDEPAARALLASWVGDGDLEVRLIAIAAIDDPERLRALLADDQPAIQAGALARLVATAGRAAALGDAARLLADAPSPGHRARIAGGWLAGGSKLH